MGAAGNYNTGLWINAFTLKIVNQAVSVIWYPSLVTLRPARFWAWLWYFVWMSICAIILLIGMCVPSMTSQFAWTWLKFPPLAAILATTVAYRNAFEHKSGTAPVDRKEGVDVEAAGDRPRAKACTKASWWKCCCNFWEFVGWSSLFFLSSLGFLLALQAAWLVADQSNYPPPGQFYQIGLQDGSSYMPYIHMLCKGPTTSSLSTFVLEAADGAPGIAYAGIVDELAAAGRRACW